MNGGAIACNNAPITCTRCTFDSNAAAEGGAYYAEGGATAAVFVDSAFTSNTVRGRGNGGAISTSVTKSLSLERTLVRGNSALGAGGGVYALFVTLLEILNSFIADNVADGIINVTNPSPSPGLGGGVCVVAAQRAAIHSSTFLGNGAGLGSFSPSLYAENVGALTVTDSILWGLTNKEVEITSPGTTQFNNTIWQAPQPCGFCTKVITEDPQLTYKATPRPHWAPAGSSPALGAGGNAAGGALDYLGNPRVGAFRGKRAGVRKARLTLYFLWHGVRSSFARAEAATCSCSHA